jgi:hypothetical protein
MVACVERRELSKNAVSAVQNLNSVRQNLTSQGSTSERDLSRLSNALGSAQTAERAALEQLVLHRQQHGC